MSLSGCGDKNDNITSVNAKETIETKETKHTKIEASTDKAEWLKVPEKLGTTTGNFFNEILLEADEAAEYTVSSKIIGKEYEDINQFKTLSNKTMTLNENNEMEIEEKDGFIYRPLYVWQEKCDILEIKVYKEGIVKNVEWIKISCDDDENYLAEDIGGIKGECLNQEAIDKYFDGNISKKAVDTP